MESKLTGYRRYFFIGLITIAHGIVFNTTLKESVGSIGTVFIAIGGFFFIVSMNMKRKEEQEKEKK